MAAPAATVRGTPEGIKLGDGFSTKLTLERNPTIALWERTVTPPGIEGGDAVDNTTMHNVTWRTMSPRKLKTLTEVSSSAAYDPIIYEDVVDQVNINQVITCTFPDGSTLAFWGFVKSFIPGENQEGTMPEGTLTIVPTNRDDDGVEQAPVLVEVAGT